MSLIFIIDLFRKKYLLLYMNQTLIIIIAIYVIFYFYNKNNIESFTESMKLNDKMYLEHMIPHHQVAVDMSKVLLKNTTSDFMIYLAYRIIRSQQAEIIILEDLKKSPYKHSSDIITQV
jgi:hypothetical protein